MLNVLIQVLDFLVKAGAAYVNTPAGQKEWNDIKQAVEGSKK